ncbi:MAG: hypothetical protein K2P81_08570 [Bacteriovoracaceae bacterium]|nr:hypothetical protein [Bacteriovoracaceae bacterium]
MDKLRRKALKLNLLMGILISSSVYGVDAKQGAIEQYEEISHENKGCPENSECDATMGKLLRQWDALSFRWKSGPSGSALLQKELPFVTAKRGWPGEFYARPAVRSTLAPVLYSSPCTQHRSKNPSEVMLRGLGFMKGVKDQHVVMTKEDTEYSLKLGEAVFLQTVVHFPPNKPPVTYYLPLEEKPLYFEEDVMVSIVERDDLYALLKAKPDGSWTFIPSPGEGLSKYSEAQEDTECPKNIIPNPVGFFKTYCQKISYQDGSPAGVVQLFWGCQ